MAYTELQSNEIPKGTVYYSSKRSLGDYTFYLQFDSKTGNATARCDYPDGIRGAGSKTFPAGTQISSWSVEANNKEASIYVKVRDSGIHALRVNCTKPWGNYFIGDVITGKSNPDMYGNEWDCTLRLSYATTVWLTKYNGVVYAAAEAGKPNCNGIYRVTSVPNEYTTEVPTWTGGWFTDAAASNRVYGDLTTANSHYANVPESSINPAGVPLQAPEGEYLVARFAINLGDAGGYPGGGGGWISPGDWNPDPTTTLHLTVNGALSGRHNDPLNDTSYSYVPADKSTVKDYGCGGDGGNGGGGGAGASTIIVRSFATNRANSKDIAALAKRHGYGSGGGKGGQGGDGCILIYY